MTKFFRLRQSNVSFCVSGGALTSKRSSPGGIHSVELDVGETDILGGPGHSSDLEGERSGSYSSRVEVGRRSVVRESAGDHRRAIGESDETASDGLHQTASVEEDDLVECDSCRPGEGNPSSGPLLVGRPLQCAEKRSAPSLAERARRRLTSVARLPSLTFLAP